MCCLREDLFLAYLIEFTATALHSRRKHALNKQKSVDYCAASMELEATADTALKICGAEESAEIHVIKK